MRDIPIALDCDVLAATWTESYASLTGRIARLSMRVIMLLGHGTRSAHFPGLGNHGTWKRWVGSEALLINCASVETPQELASAIGTRKGTRMLTQALKVAYIE
jgi:hypothetical protein